MSPDRESPRNVRVEFGSEGVESKEVSEQPSEGVSDKGLEWKEHAVVLGIAGRGSK